jgi:carnosine N-methyltransferase
MESNEERQHWRDVLRAFDGYMQYHVGPPPATAPCSLLTAQLAGNHARRMAFLALPREQRDIYEAIGYRDKLEAVDEGIRR